MHWFLVIYMYSTPDLLVTETESKERCLSLRNELRQELYNNKDLKKISCERGEILDSYKPETSDESL